MLRDEKRDVLNDVEFRDYVSRALQVDSDTAGGYFLNQALYAQLLKQESEVSIVRQLAAVLPPVTGDSVSVPSQEAAMASSSLWTSEVGSAPEESTVTYGAKVLYPHRLAKLIKVSDRLLRSAPHAEMFITDAMARAIGVAQDTAFIQGDGVGQPNGILNETGVTTVQSGSAVGVTWDAMLDFIYSLPSEYHYRATILTTVDFMELLLKVQDASGYQHNIISRKGEILGYPVRYSTGMPTAVTAGLGVEDAYAAIIGDFKAGYYIGDSDVISVQRLTETYAATSQVGFIVQQETDGVVAVPNAFVKLQIGTS